MNSIERFLRTAERKDVDHPACWLGIPDESALPLLFGHFGVKSVPQLKALLDDDLWPVELPYHSPFSNHIYSAFDFSKKGAPPVKDRTLTAPGWFEDHMSLNAVEEFPWPDPQKYISPSLCRQAVSNVPQGKATLGVLWSAHFQDTCAAFGMEQALMCLIEEPKLFQAVDEKIVDFYLRANRIFLENTAGSLQAVLIGNDLGSQTGLIMSQDMISRYVLPGAKRLIEQAHHYGVKVIYHSCGAVSDMFDDLVNIGVDILHPIQALAHGMEPTGLKKRFGDRVSFCGGVDAQNLLVNGTPEMIRQKVAELRRLFPTGLIISPSHEAILSDISPSNVEMLIRASQGNTL